MKKQISLKIREIMKTFEKYRILIITKDEHVAQIVDFVLTGYFNETKVEIWLSKNDIVLPALDGRELLIIDSEKLIDKTKTFWRDYLMKNPNRLVLLLMSHSELEDVKKVLDELDKEDVKCTVDFIMAENYSFDLKLLMIKAYIQQLVHIKSRIVG